MRLQDLTTPYEQHKVFMYAADGNKVVRRTRTMRKVTENIYINQPYAYEYGQKYFDVFICYDGVERGIKVDTCLGWYLDEPDGAEMVIERVGKYACAEWLIERIQHLIQEENHIPMLYVEFVGQFRPDLVPAMMESRKQYGERKSKEAKERREKREAEEAEFVRAQNENADQIVENAIAILRSGGNLENKDVTYYKGRHDSSTYSVVNYLFRKYGIKLPLRTAGWVNSSLSILVIKDEKCEELYYKKLTKTTKASQVIYDYVNQLIAAVNQK